MAARQSAPVELEGRGETTTRGGHSENTAEEDDITIDLVPDAEAASADSSRRPSTQTVVHDPDAQQPADEIVESPVRSRGSADNGSVCYHSSTGRKGVVLDGKKEVTSMETIVKLSESIAESSTAFIKADALEPKAAANRRCSLLVRLAKDITASPKYDFFTGAVVLVDFAAICRDTDLRASDPEATETVLSTIMDACFVIYLMDLALRFIENRWKSFRSKAYLLDVFVVCVSLLEHALKLAEAMAGGSSIIMVRMIRLCRLLRITRVVKFFGNMRELRRLIQMIATGARTMFWSFLMSFIIMTMFAVLAVELVQPVALELIAEGQFAGCDRCEWAFGTVMAANLTFFQTVFAGDSWGLLAIPIMERSPGTSFIFCGVVLTLTYGIMQLITAVVVDSFGDLRKLDVNTLAAEIEAEEKQEKEALMRIFQKVDADNSGEVTFEELAQGATKVKELQDWLRVMDIDGSDLARLFQILDVNSNGCVNLPEFMDALYRLKNAEFKTTTKFVKHIVEDLERATGHVYKSCEDLQKRMHEVLEAVQSERQDPNCAEAEEDKAKQEEQQPMLRVVEDAVQRATAVSLEAALKGAVERIQAVAYAGSGHCAVDAWSGLRQGTASTTSPRHTQTTISTFESHVDGLKHQEAAHLYRKPAGQLMEAGLFGSLTAVSQLATSSGTGSPPKELVDVDVCRERDPRLGDPTFSSNRPELPLRPDERGQEDGVGCEGRCGLGEPDSPPWLEFLKLGSQEESV
eukprot:TRINITY_DN30936_c0_g4_i1.p1 TRINITY_DN30936_c0_g4~~TRINITY_DN30936_c0_g4_i1.p1  ORF type:complete len:748 (+),score=163.96 TRINITY_DN30936_c0_g4_i1:240-2483(+)